MARSQRRLRERQGFDSSGDTAYQFGERSNLTNPQQYLASVANGYNPPLPSGIALPVNTVAPSVTGTAAVGQTLTSALGTWTGTATLTYARQWKRGGVAISGATGATYVLVQADAGSAITCTVTASNSYGSTSATGTATAAVTGPPVNTVLPALTGDTLVALTGDPSLVVSNGTWTGHPAPTFTYQWERDGTPIDGQTDSEYFLDAEDVGLTLTCVVTATNATDDVAAESAASDTINSAPIINTPPTITGTAQEGETLTAGTGVWLDHPNSTFTYQWKRDTVDISGATANTRLLALADVGAVITVTVNALNTYGQASSTSDPTDEVIGA
jgi:hypothetical protein